MVDIHPETLRLARQWAGWAKDLDGIGDEVSAAIEVILSLSIDTIGPRPGEAWLIDVAGRERESIKLDHSNLSWITVDDYGITVCYMNSEITPIRRLNNET